MKKEDQFDLIFENQLFRDVDRDTLKAVFCEHCCQASLFSDGEIIHAPSSTQKKIGIILSGKASVSTPHPTNGTLLRFLKEGELFGVANFYSNNSFASVIQACGECKVFFFPEKAISVLLETNRTFMYNYLCFLSGRISYLNQKIGYLTAGSAERKLVWYLHSLGSDTVYLTDSISSLSELLDVGRASLYRAFDRLIADGFIVKDGRRIQILNSENMLSAYL